MSAYSTKGFNTTQQNRIIMNGSSFSSSSSSFTAEALLLAMAEIPKVLDAFQAATATADDDDDDDTIANGPDAFARLLQKHWMSLPSSTSCHDSDRAAAAATGPSPRYLRALLQQYVRRIGEDAAEASEELLQVIMWGILHNNNNVNDIPNPNESCHVSFWIPPALSSMTAGNKSEKNNDNDDWLLLLLLQQQQPLPAPLRIRIFPYHNNVGLRIWEAGVALSEFLLQNRHWVQHQRVVELGAGTGVTGLVAAGACGAAHVFCTDYTETSLENLHYNLETNRLWLQEQRNEKISECELWDCISYGYLEWGAFSAIGATASAATSETNNRGWEGEDDRLHASMESMSQATVLLAADVAYDTSIIGSLAQTIRYFLQGSTRSKKKKQALIATTLRNNETFTSLQDKIVEEGITIKLEIDDCSGLPMYFPLKFVQPRSDVKIYSLTLSRDKHYGHAQ